MNKIDGVRTLQYCQYMTRKTRTIQLRVTDEQHAFLQRKAKERGFDMSAWIRHLTECDEGKATEIPNATCDATQAKVGGKTGIANAPNGVAQKTFVRPFVTPN